MCSSDLEQIGIMVNDLISTTQAGLIDTGLVHGDVEAIRNADHALVRFSDEMRQSERALKKFMYANLYHHPQQLAGADRARVIVTDLFNAYQNDPALMGEAWDVSCATEEPMRSRHIADYIAGMTDRFAERAHREIYGNKLDRRMH